MVKAKIVSAIVLGWLAFSGVVKAQGPSDFDGQWVVKLDKHVFLLLKLVAPAGKTDHFTGSLSRPQHFTTGGASLSGIKEPTVEEGIVGSSVNGKCLAFTTQNPADKSETDFQLCTSEPGRGTLRIVIPGMEGWPVTKEAGTLTVWTEWEAGRTYIPDEVYTSNADMQRIFSEDQKDRQGSNIDWVAVGKADEARREATRVLLQDGKLHTGEDFQMAAFVFQHGHTSDDFLLAHTLATVAVAKGESSAIWIAAATLDRYLQSIHQSQIYGTQFLAHGKEPTTQEPYNRELVSDALRRQLGVPSLAAQEEQTKQYDHERGLKP